MLNDNIIVLPCHTSKPVEFNHIAVQATLGSIKETVSMLHLNEEDFTNTILQRIPPTPANYLSIVEKILKEISAILILLILKQALTDALFHNAKENGNTIRIERKLEAVYFTGYHQCICWRNGWPRKKYFTKHC